MTTVVQLLPHTLKLHTVSRAGKANELVSATFTRKSFVQAINRVFSQLPTRHFTLLLDDAMAYAVSLSIDAVQTASSPQVAAVDALTHLVPEDFVSQECFVSVVKKEDTVEYLGVVPVLFFYRHLAEAVVAQGKRIDRVVVASVAQSRHVDVVVGAVRAPAPRLKLATGAPPLSLSALIGFALALGMSLAFFLLR